MGKVRTTGSFLMLYPTYKYFTARKFQKKNEERIKCITLYCYS